MWRTSIAARNGSSGDAVTRASSRRRQPRQNGMAVDASGGPVVDPTENVKDLTEAANIRQDDLRNLNNLRIDSEITWLKYVEGLRAEHAREIRELESKRLDSIRQVDVTAVKTEADRALAAIQALAATNKTDAENLRTALQNTAQTIAKSNSDTVQQLAERISALEKSNYELAGKQAVQDPAQVELLRVVKSLTEGQAVGTGKGLGYANVIGMVILALAVGGFLVNALK
jgi:hypothetical protein